MSWLKPRPTKIPEFRTRSKATTYRDFSNLQNVAFARDHFVEHWVDKKAQNQARDESGDDHDRERFLRVGTDAGGKRRGQQAQASDQRGHHDRTQAQQRSFARSGANVVILQAQLVDVRDENYGGLHRNAHQREQTEHGRNTEGRVRKFQRDERAHRLRHDHTQRDSHREFEIAIERKEDHENQQHCERADDQKLLLGFNEFAVFAAPAEAVARRQRFFHVRDGPLAVFYGAGQIAAFDAVLHADVARLIFAINEGRAVAFANIGKLAEGNLLAGGSADEQVRNLLGVLTELRLHADDEIE